MKKILILLLLCGFWANAQQYHDKGAKFENATDIGNTITTSTRIPIIDEFGLINYYVDVADLLALNPAPVLEWGNITGTLSNQTDLQSALNDKADQSALTAHTSNGNIHFTQSAISITESQITDLKDYLRGDVNDTNGGNKLTLGSLEVVGQTTLQNGLNMTSVPTGTSDNILTINGSGDVEQRVFSLGDIDIANSAGVSQFPVGLGDQLRIQGSGDTSISFDGITNTININSVPGSGGGGAVTSFNGRDGAVVSQAGDYSTAMVNENTNLYFTEARVRGTDLTGLAVTNTPISSTNTFIQALGRLQGQINDRITGSYTGFDSRYVNVTGDAMSGQLSISNSNLDALSIDQNNTNSGAYIRNSGTGRAMIVRSNGGDLIQFRNDLNQQVAVIQSGGTIRTDADLYVGGSATIGSGVTGSPIRARGFGIGDANVNFIRLYESNGSISQGDIGFTSGGDSTLRIVNNVSGTSLNVSDSGGENGLQYFTGSSTRTVYHDGNLTTFTDGRYYTKGQSDSNYVLKNARTDGGYAWIRYNGTGSSFYTTNQSTGDLARFQQGAGDGVIKARISNNGSYISEGDVIVQGVVSGSNLSGTNTGDQIAGDGLVSNGSTIDVVGAGGISTTGNAVTLTPITAGDTSFGTVQYTGTSISSGKWYGGSSNPVSTTRLNYDGNLYATTMFSGNFTLTSDRRAKTKIKPINLPPLDIEWKQYELKNHKGEVRYGVIAQDLEANGYNQFVTEDDQGKKSVKYFDLLVAKIAELEARIKELEYKLQQ